MICNACKRPDSFCECPATRAKPEPTHAQRKAADPPCYRCGHTPEDLRARVLAALDLLDRVRFRASPSQLPSGVIAAVAWEAAHSKPLSVISLESYGLQLSDLPALIRAGVLVPEVDDG